jgi:hypothetical protein
MASFFEGAVGGFFKGRDWREGVEERKRARKIDDQRFEWEKEDRDYTLDVRGDEKKERKRRIRLQDEEDQFWRDLAAGDSTEPPTETTETVQPPVAASAVETAPVPVPAPTPAATAPVTSPIPRRREIRVDPTVAAAPASPPGPAQKAGPEPAPPTQAGGVAAPTGRVIAKIPDTAPDQPFQPAPTAQEPTYEEWQAMSREDRAEAGLPVSEIGGQWHYRNRDGAWGAPAKPQGPTVPQRAPAAPDAPDYSEPPVALPGSASDRDQVAPTAPQSMLEAMAEDTRLDPNTRMIARDRAEGAGRQRDISAAANSRSYASLQPTSPAAPSPDQLPVTASGTPMASVETVEKAASEVPAPKSAKGAAAASDKAAAAFRDDYMTTQADKIVKFYMSRGEVEKAKTYSDWVKDTQVQKGMEHWARAVHAASIGDSGKFVSEIARAYNSSGYFDDGYSIVEEASGIHKDPQTGAVTGGQITFRNEKTGETFTQDFDNSRDLYELGVNFLSPEQVFEFGWKQIAGQEEFARKMAEKGVTNDAAKKVAETIKTLSDANAEFGLMPLDQQIAEALAFLGRFDGSGGTGEVPVARRP